MRNFIQLAKYLAIIIIMAGVIVGVVAVSAAIFDSDLIPSLDNEWNLGLGGSNRWRDARFSGNVGIGVDLARENEITSGDRLVLGNIDTALEGGQLKILGAENGFYTVLDNYDNNLRILTKGTEAEKEVMRVTEFGRVLIGTSTTNLPQEKLEVVGNIISKGTEWTVRSISNLSNYNNDWRSVTYGNGLFVAVSWDGTRDRVMTSLDGINWTKRTTPAAESNWSSITYGNGLFVAVADGGGTGTWVMTSPDGINWTNRVPARYNHWQSVTYGNGLFVAVAKNDSGTCISGTSNQCVMISPDGINWTLPPVTPNNYWSSVTYGNGLFVAVASSTSNNVMTSSNGISWTTPSTAPPSKAWASVTYGNGRFVAVAEESSGDRVMTSTNGADWTSVSTPTIDENEWRSVTYGNGLFVAVSPRSSSAEDNRVITSPDGVNWTSRWTPTPASESNYRSWSSVTYGNGIFVAVSWSGDGSSYNVMTSGKPDYTITPHNNIYQGGMKILGGTVAVGTTTQTGLFHVESGTLNALYISSSTGNIGIGTNNPSNTNALTIDGAGGIRIRQPSATRYRSDYLVSNSSTSIISYDDTTASLAPLNLYGQAITFNAGSGGAEKSSIDASGYWYLGGTTPINGLRIKGSDTTNTISQPSGNLGITANSGHIILNATRVGIATTTPQQKLQVFGNIRIGAGINGCIQDFEGATIAGACSSDIALKKNLIPLSGSLEKIVELKPTYFNWRADEFPELHLNGDVRNLGLIAQDVEKVFPELVGRDEYGLKTVDYGVDLIMHAIESIKELKEKSDENEERIKMIELNH